MKITTLRMTIELYEQLERMSKIRGMTVHGLIIAILWEWIERRK